MHTGLITAGMDMLPITANGDIAEQATASVSNMIKRGLDNLPLKHKKPQGILSYFNSAYYYPVIFLNILTLSKLLFKSCFVNTVYYSFDREPHHAAFYDGSELSKPVQYSAC